MKQTLRSQRLSVPKIPRREAEGAGKDNFVVVALLAQPGRFFTILLF
jgi:hypothetical protein